MDPYLPPVLAIPPPYCKLELMITEEEGIRVMAMVDTGAACSLLSTQQAKLYKLETMHIKGDLIAFNGSRTARVVTKHPITIRCGRFPPITMQIDVSDISDPASGGEHFIMGRDLQRYFQIGVGPLPQNFPNEYGAHDPEVGYEKARAPRRVLDDPLPPEQEIARTKFRNLMEQVMASHALAVSTSDFICHPDAVVSVDHVPDTVPVYTKQYGSKNPEVHQMMSKAVADLLLEGRIQVYDQGLHGYLKYNIALIAIITYNRDHSIKKCRLCWDCREINKGLVMDHFPIANIRSIYEQAGANGNLIWSELDLRGAFLQFPLHENSKPKMAFTWNGVVYTSNSAVFGLAHMAQICSRVLTQIFADMPFVFPYCDNLMVGSKTIEDHFHHLVLVVRRCNFWKIRLNIPRCFLFYTIIKSLGNILSRDGIIPDPERVEDILSWSIPANAEQLSRWLGMMGYLRSFIRHYSELTSCLDRLRNVDNKTFNSLWSQKHVAAIELLKRALAHCPMLRHPDWNKLFVIAIDACNTGIGGVLYQPHKPDDPPAWDTIIFFWSRAVTEAERHYSTYRLELTAIVVGIKQCDEYIFNRPFVIRTDHNALVYMHTSKILNKVLLGHFEFLCMYVFKLIHIAGTINNPADGLSRAYEIGAPWGVSPSDSRPDLITKSSATDEDMRINLVGKLDFDPATNEQELKENPSYVSFGVPQQVPASLTLARTLIEQLHNDGGHYGVNHTMKALQADGFSWLGMKELVQTVVYNCKACRLWTPMRATYARLRQTSQILLLPWDVVQFDVLSGFPKATQFLPAQENDIIYECILVIYDVFTGYIIAKALVDHTARTCAIALASIFADFGFPRSVQSDNAPEFVSKVLTSFFEEVGVPKNLIPAYAPRYNGGVERAVGKVKLTLHKMMSSSNFTWVNLLPGVQLALNMMQQESSGNAPFSLMFNRHLNRFESWRDCEPLNESCGLDMEEWQRRQEFQHNTLFPAFIVRRDQDKKQQADSFEKTHTTSHKVLPKGAVVMLKDVNVKDKMSHPYVGPYFIHAVTDNNNYIIKDTAGAIFPRQCTRDMLKVQHHAQDLQDAAAYVDTITDHRQVKQLDGSFRWQYLVDWLGTDKPTWEYATQFDDEQAITTYHTKLSKLPARKQPALISESTLSSSSSSSSSPSSSSDYEVQEILNHSGVGHAKKYLIRWVGFPDPEWVAARSVHDGPLRSDYEARILLPSSQASSTSFVPTTTPHTEPVITSRPMFADAEGPAALKRVSIPTRR